MRKVEFDVKKYDFADIVRAIFDCNDLQYIHQELPSHIVYDKLHKLGEDNKTWYHEKFYEPINNGNSEFQRLYEDFVVSFISKETKLEKFLYQKSPTFRVHAPNNVAVGGWHRDRDYNHSTKEINVFLPLTSAFKTNTLWVEQSEDSRDYHPLEASYGEIYFWDGANLKHGNKTNKTGVSRVSVDFRILPYEHYVEDNEKTSVCRGKRFILGDYYSLYEAKK